MDAPEDGNFPRASVARRDGLHAAFGFPLLSPRGVVGVMEFFSSEAREPDERLLETMREIGSQVGQFVARRHAEEEVHASESRLRAMLEAALDAVVTMDHRGRVVGWNHAAETTFGYRVDEVVGREMAELIVPPESPFGAPRGTGALRRDGAADRPRQARRVHRDAQERGGVPGRARRSPGSAPRTADLHRLPAGHHRAQAGGGGAARVARPLVEVADAERQRIQRNLHDGAQQRLTAVLLSLGRLRESQGGGDGLLAGAIDELSAGLQEIRSSRAACTRPCSRSAVSRGRSRRPRSGRPSRSSSRWSSTSRSGGVEAAAYYVVAEGLANVHKHADATHVSVSVAVEDATSPSTSATTEPAEWTRTAAGCVG